jgi:hypothetical protein
MEMWYFEITKILFEGSVVVWQFVSQSSLTDISCKHSVL